MIIAAVVLSIARFNLDPAALWLVCHIHSAEARAPVRFTNETCSALRNFRDILLECTETRNYVVFLMHSNHT